MQDEHKTAYIWCSYFKTDDDCVADEIIATDQDGKVIFKSIIQLPMWAQLNYEDVWQKRAREHGYSEEEIANAPEDGMVGVNLYITLRKYGEDKMLDVVSYNAEFNLPFDLRKLLHDCPECYRTVDLMKIFADIYGEKIVYYDYYLDEQIPENKWQKISKFFDYYDVKPKSDSAYDYVTAIRKCYEKMNK